MQLPVSWTWEKLNTKVLKAVKGSPGTRSHEGESSPEIYERGVNPQMK